MKVPSGLDAEILVVGASLAGLVAAEEAAKSGANTLLVDAAPEIGARANPANIIMEPLWPGEVPIPRKAISRKLSGVKLGGPAGRGPSFRFDSYHVDRRAFDSAFAQRARDAGAELRSGVEVERVLRAGGVQTPSGPVRARITIFADGARSSVREILPTMRNPHDVAWGLDQLLEGPGLGAPEYFEVRFGSLAPGWRAQYNPLGGNRASLWTFARGAAADDLDCLGKRTLEAFTGGREACVIEEVRGADPAFVWPRRIAGDAVLACGAAAAQGGLENGARAGLRAARTAARALAAGDASRKALRTYERSWMRLAFGQLVAIRCGVGAVGRLSDAEIDALFGTLEGTEFGEREFVSLLRGDPRGLLRKVGNRRLLGMAWPLLRGMILRNLRS